MGGAGLGRSSAHYLFSSPFPSALGGSVVAGSRFCFLKSQADLSELLNTARKVIRKVIRKPAPQEAPGPEAPPVGFGGKSGKGDCRLQGGTQRGSGTVQGRVRVGVPAAARSRAAGRSRRRDVTKEQG